MLRIPTLPPPPPALFFVIITGIPILHYAHLDINPVRAGNPGVLQRLYRNNPHHETILRERIDHQLNSRYGAGMGRSVPRADSVALKLYWELLRLSPAM